MKLSNRVKRHASLLATKGQDCKDWYQFAHAQVIAGAVILDVEPKRFADLLAIFSPRVSVTRSIRFAVHYIQTGQHAHDVMGSIRAAVAHYEETGEIRGPKTGPFAKALMGNPTAIVVDTWMAIAYGVDPGKVRSKYVREPIDQHIRSVAKRKGWSPAETQAAIWAGIVRQHGRNVPQLFIEPEVDNVAPF
jgi:hypothetical protein